MVTSGNSRYRFPVSLARALTTAGEIFLADDPDPEAAL
jgi:ABC-type phosphate/phosphonate transport system ATPase subunit